MAIWEKLFSKIIFEDYPDTSTPLNATNLNKMTDAIDGIDDRVVELNSNLDNMSKLTSGSVSENNTTVGVKQNIYYRKRGNVVELWTIQNVNVSALGYYKLDLTLPEGFRPSGSVTSSVTMKSGTTYNIGRVNISPDGGIAYDIGATGLREFKWQVSYIVI